MDANKCIGDLLTEGVKRNCRYHLKNIVAGIWGYLNYE